MKKCDAFSIRHKDSFIQLFGMIDSPTVDIKINSVLLKISMSTAK